MNFKPFFIVIFLSGCVSLPKEPPRQIDLSSVPNINRGLKIIKIPNSYFPMKAAKARQQGWCISQFDVNKKGIPINISIADCSPKEYFEKACTIQTGQLRFALDGVPVNGVSYRCSYKIE